MGLNKVLKLISLFHAVTKTFKLHLRLLITHYISEGEFWYTAKESLIGLEKN